MVATRVWDEAENSDLESLLCYRRAVSITSPSNVIQVCERTWDFESENACENVIKNSVTVVALSRHIDDVVNYSSRVTAPWRGSVASALQSCPAPGFLTERPCIIIGFPPIPTTVSVIDQ
jgi:hypothetical protein